MNLVLLASQIFTEYFCNVNSFSSCFVDLGKLDKGAVLKGICSGFQETTEPAICLTEGPE